jgi:hypothetical protein
VQPVSETLETNRMPLMLSRRTTALRIRMSEVERLYRLATDGRRIDLLDSPEVLRPALGARGESCRHSAGRDCGPRRISESVSGFGCHAHLVGPSLSGNLEVKRWA